MKQLSRFLLFISISLLISVFQLNGQFVPTKVEKSTQKVLHKGKVYYIHTIKSGQTLYSISRAYNVTVQDIAAANPNVVLEVISEGQVLKIPALSKLDEFSESYFGLTKDDFYYHTVRSQETVHFLSKKYNVSAEDIHYYNPGSNEMIQIGQVIKIPKEHVLLESPPLSDSGEDTYTVKQGDTLYSLSKKYGVSIAELIRINPQLRWGLKTGMVLSLNSNLYDPLAGLDSISHSKISTFKFFTEDVCDSIKTNYKSKPIKAVLLAPFHAKEILALDTITNDSVRKVNPNYKYLSRGIGSTEYYEGFLLSLDSIKKTGVDITLFAYDTKSDTIKIKEIIKELDIIQPDIIFGPMMADNIKKIAYWAETNQVAMVIPMQNNDLDITQNNPYVVNMLPSSTTEMNKCADYLSQFHDKNIILIHNEDSVGSARIKEFKETLFAYFSSRSSYEEVLYKEIRLNDTSEKNLQHTLRENMVNIVFTVSTNEAFVSNVIGLLRIQQSMGYQIELLGLPIWQSFDNLRIELLHMLNTVIYSPFLVDYTKKETKAFLLNSRKKLGFEPFELVNSGKGYNYTILGYETGLLFINYFNEYGKDFRNCLCHQKDVMPQADYQFEWDNKQLGIYNTSISYKNYTTDFTIKSLDFESLKDLNSKPKPLEDLDVSPFLQKEE